MDHHASDMSPAPGSIRYTAADFEETARLVQETALEGDAGIEEYLRKEAAGLFDDKPARQLLGLNETAAVVADDETAAKIREAIAKDAAHAAAQDASQGAGQNALPGSDPGSKADSLVSESQAPTASTASGNDAPPEKPSSYESALASIKLEPKRQNLLNIEGDESIRRRFYDALAVRGDLIYKGGQPLIICSRKSALQLLDKVASEVEGGMAVAGARVRLDREAQNGFFGLSVGRVMAAIKNNSPIDMRHSVDTVFVGTKEVIDEKQKAYGAVVEHLEQKGHLKEGSSILYSNSLSNRAAGPVELEGTATLYAVVSLMKDKVEAYKEHEKEKEVARKEFRAQKDDKAIAEHAEKTATANGGNGVEQVSDYAEKLAAKLDASFKSPDLLYQNTGNRQVAGEYLLNQAHRLGDPAARELQTLPTETRQPAIVQIAAMVQLADSKAFGVDAKHKEAAMHHLDAKSPGASSIREKSEQLIAMELQRDPSFGATAEKILTDMTSREILTPEQAQTIRDVIARETPAQANQETLSAEPPAATQQPTAAEHQASADAVAQSAQAPDEQQSGASKDGQVAGSSAPADAQQQPQAHAAADPQSEAFKDAQTPTSGQQVEQPGDVQPAQQAFAFTDAEAVAVAPVQPAEKDASPAATADTPADPQQVPELAVAGDDFVETPNLGPASEEETFDVPVQHANDFVEDDNFVPPVEDTGVAEQPPAATADATQDAPPAVDTTAPDRQQDGQSPHANEQSLRDKLEAAAATGKASLSESDALSLLSAIDAIRTKPLSELDNGSGAAPTLTLVRAEGLVTAAAEGTFGAEAKAMGKDLQETLGKWSEQDLARVLKDGGTETSVKEGRAKLKLLEPQWHGADAATEAASERGAAPKDAAPPAKEVAAGQAAQQDSSAATKLETIREAQAQKVWDTEMAGARLASMMSNPAGSFTNRDKTWNAANVDKAAGELMKVSPEALQKLSPQQQATTAAYGAWLASNALEGKLPGFSGEEGRARANALGAHAVALVEAAGGDKFRVPPDAQKALDKGDRMVAAMDARERGLAPSKATEATRQQTAEKPSISPAAASALARDLVHSVYTSGEMRDAQAKYLLKNAPELTANAMKSLDPELKAKTAVAMGELATQVKNGAMGDFDKLPNAVQRHTHAAARAADTLQHELGKDPAMRTELNNAVRELTEKQGMSVSSAASHKVSTPEFQSALKDAQDQVKANAGQHIPGDSKTPSKNADRGLER